MSIEDRDEEFALLKERAEKIGLKVGPNISLETLRQKVNTALSKETPESKRAAVRKAIRDEELKLVRIRLSVMNPAKKTWRGEIFTFANAEVGTVKKFVPFDPKFYTNGYHVPNCIYKMLRDKKFLNIYTKESGSKITVQKDLVNEFSISVLPPLTKEELLELANAQAAGNRIDEN